MGEDEFTALFNELSGRLFGFAARRLSPQAAEDLVAQTFETAWGKRDNCPAEPNARIGWVFAIGRLKILQELDHRRRKPHDHRFTSDFGQLPLADPDFSDAVVESATGRWIYQQLAVPDQELFDIAFIRDVTREQASAMLGISVGTFNTRVSRLRSRIHALRCQVDSDNCTLEGGAQ